MRNVLLYLILAAFVVIAAVDIYLLYMGHRAVYGELWPDLETYEMPTTAPDARAADVSSSPGWSPVDSVPVTRFEARMVRRTESTWIAVLCRENASLDEVSFTRSQILVFSKKYATRAAGHRLVFLLYEPAIAFQMAAASVEEKTGRVIVRILGDPMETWALQDDVLILKK